MAKIKVERAYDGFERVLGRFGLKADWDDMIQFLSGIQLRVKESRDSNSGKAVRVLVDAEFAARTAQGWTNARSGTIDWTKTVRRGGIDLKLGIEVQVSARSDMIAVDLMHLNQAFKNGELDVGAILVPADRLAAFLTDRAPSLSETWRHFALFVAIEDRPVALLTIEHDGPGPALKKQLKRARKVTSRRALKR